MASLELNDVDDQDTPIDLLAALAGLRCPVLLATFSISLLQTLSSAVESNGSQNNGMA